MQAAAPSRRSARITVVCSDESALPLVEDSLAPFFHTTFVSPISEIGEILALRQEAPPDAIILDIDPANAESPDGCEMLRALRAADPDLLLFAITRVRSRQLRLRAQTSGADVVLIAPADCNELKAQLEQALEERQQEIERRNIQEQARSKTSFCDLVGASEAMRNVYSAILRVADSSTTVVIRGESGTGKELVARAIVSNSTRRDKPFISVNCAALPETLIEAELFGHEKGSFTGAHESRSGHFEAAQGGTVFLDEISALGLNLQSKLLRVLEEHTVQRIGSRATKKIDFRLLTASNDDLEEMVRAGRFREDLYYRIHVVPIFLPPLRERKGDIPLLADHFVRFYCAANKLPLKRLEAEVIEVLEEYTWPGNVRELENLMQRLVLMGEGTVIKPKHLPQPILFHATTSQEALLIPEDGIDFDEEMARTEVAYLSAALRRTKGRKSAAAQLLSLDPQRMKYLCRKYRIAID